MALFARLDDRSPLIDRVLRRLVESEAISAVDRMTALALASRSTARPALAAALGVIMSHLRARGHVCAALDRAQETPLWRLLSERLEGMGSTSQATVTGLVGDAARNPDRPLILERGLLYFQRGWVQESELAEALERLARAPSPALESAFEMAVGLSLEQRQAVRTALERRLCVVSGGPGSGKTTVAGAIVDAFLDARSGNHGEVGLAAPTGKAATRLAASVNRALARRDDSPEIEARTLHRLLGWNRERAGFRFGPSRRLPLKLLIVDEVSMVDLDLMHALLGALERDCALVLLGDRDQLASVQPGSVLADICAGLDSRAGSAELRRCIVLLRRSFRFRADSGIGALGAAINRGDAAATLRVLRSGREGLRWRERPPADFSLSEPFAPAIAQPDPAAALSAFDRFRVLCVHRRGRYGSETVNRSLIAELKERGLAAAVPNDEYFDGQLFVVVGNHYGIGLFNGEQGIIRRAEEGGLQAFIQRVDGDCRRLAPHRLPETEPGYCLTVHRSQGSEFERVLLILPDEASPLLSRELLYTAITRARREIEIWGSPGAIRAAVERSMERGSGLARRLWERTDEAPEPGATRVRSGRPSQGELF